MQKESKIPDFNSVFFFFFTLHMYACKVVVEENILDFVKYTLKNAKKFYNMWSKMVFYNNYV